MYSQNINEFIKNYIILSKYVLPNITCAFIISNLYIISQQTGAIFSKDIFIYLSDQMADLRDIPHNWTIRFLQTYKQLGCLHIQKEI